MQKENALNVPSPASTPIAPDVVGVQKQDLARQVVAASKDGGGDGGLFAQLSGNPFFAAGFGLAALGVATTYAGKGFRSGAALIRRRLLVDVEINVKDDSYPWFLYWMTLHQRRQLVNVKTSEGIPDGSNSRKVGIFESILRRLTPGMHHLSIQTEKVALPNGAMHTHFALIPGPGRHVLRYRDAFILVNRVRDAKSINMANGQPWETVTLTTLYSQRHIFQALFQEAHALAAESVEGKTVIYNQWGDRWQKFGNPRSKRPLESVVLDTGIKEKIVTDVQDFFASAKWYQDRGIPYRRGYLLHGPPGTGKSSFIQALAGHLDYDIAILNLSERGLTDDKLMHLLTIIPQRTLVLLEDVDVAFANRRQADADGYNGANVTFSGLLNALDGVASAEERVIFLTTNHVDRLDEALVRPGRVDMTVRLGHASRYQIELLWDRFYSDLEGSEFHRTQFCEKLSSLGVLDIVSGQSVGISTASLQGLFLYNKGDMKGAIAMVEQLAASHRPPREPPVASKGAVAQGNA